MNNKKRYRMRRSTPYKRKRNILIIVCCGVLALGTGAIYWLLPEKEQEVQLEIPEGDLTVEKQGDTQQGEVSNQIVIEEESLLDQEIIDKATEYLKSMNAEAKVAQLLWVTPEELTDFTLTVQAGETTKTKLTTYPVSGIVYTSQNFEVSDQMELMLNNTKLYSRFPIFLAIDEEGLVPITNLKMESTDVGLNVEIMEDACYFVQDGLREDIGDSLEIVIYENGMDVVESINEGTDILFIQSGFDEVYNILVDAVRAGTITTSTMDERIMNTLVYKIKKGL